MAWQRKTPFGYMVRDGKTVICPKEADAVRSIYHRYLAGASYARIAEEMSLGTIPYHQHTPQWNKHMIKRILENGKYLGTDIYPRLVSDEDFLAVQLQREDKTDCVPCPASLNPIREKAVCAVCDSRIARDTKTHGKPRWVCTNPGCGAIVHISDDAIQKQVSERLRQLADAPALLTPPSAPIAAPSADALRIQNEFNLCFNRADINSDYMKALIFAAAAEQYSVLPDLTVIHDMEEFQARLEACPASESDLQELLAKAVKAIRIGEQDTIELELTNGQIIGKEPAQ
ncbi:MAG: recombinase family protein [Oscillospiraceae bacterium]|nr:recombinase family protein [Oscillospiraceae bacterium]